MLSLPNQTVMIHVESSGVGITLIVSDLWSHPSLPQSELEQYSHLISDCNWQDWLHVWRMNIISDFLWIPGPSWGLSVERPEKGKRMLKDEMKPELFSSPGPSHISPGWGKLPPSSYLKTCFSFLKHLLLQLPQASSIYVLSCLWKTIILTQTMQHN